MGKTKKEMPATVRKVIKPVGSEPEKAEITVHEGEDLYKEIRIENKLTDEKGERANSRRVRTWMSSSKPIRTQQRKRLSERRMTRGNLLQASI